MKKLNVVTMNGITYLGSIKEEDNKVTLLKAMRVSNDLTKDDFMKYLEQKNLGRLEPVNFGGNGNQYSIQTLSPTQKILLKECKLNMKHAKLTAAANNENSVFRGLMGK